MNLDRTVQKLPGTAAALTQVVIDNPGQFALITAGTIVAARAAFNIVQPRGPLEVLALFGLLQFALPQLVMAAAEKGLITFYVRDREGCKIPLTFGEPSDAKPVQA